LFCATRIQRELHVVVARERIEHAAGAIAHADDGHPHAVVGALPGEQGLGGCDCQRGRAILQELSSMHHHSLGMNFCGVYTDLACHGLRRQATGSYNIFLHQPSCRSPSGMSIVLNAGPFAGREMRRNWPAPRPVSAADALDTCLHPWRKPRLGCPVRERPCRADRPNSADRRLSPDGVLHVGHVPEL
jgi:hypothetical protein